MSKILICGREPKFGDREQIEVLKEKIRQVEWEDMPLKRFTVRSEYTLTSFLEVIARNEGEAEEKAEELLREEYGAGYFDALDTNDLGEMPKEVVQEVLGKQTSLLGR